MTQPQEAPPLLQHCELSGVVGQYNIYYIIYYIIYIYIYDILYIIYYKQTNKHTHAPRNESSWAVAEDSFCRVSHKLI